MSGLTSMQSATLAFIEGYVAEHRYSPSYDEIKDAMGFASKTCVHRLMNSLEERGRIRRIYGKARSIEIVAESADDHLRRILDLIAADGSAYTHSQVVMSARAWVERRRS